MVVGVYGYCPRAESHMTKRGDSRADKGNRPTSHLALITCRQQHFLLCCTRLILKMKGYRGQYNHTEFAPVNSGLG